MSPWIDLFIVALLPLSALFAVLQKNPYAALVSRGIMGVMAVMLYTVMGAPDVALTEALVGTLLTVMLFAIAVRSSMSIRVGLLDGEPRPDREHPLRAFCRDRHLAIRWVRYEGREALAEALKRGRLDAVRADQEVLTMLQPYLPAKIPSLGRVVLLAAHGHWHERTMQPHFDSSEPLVRLRKPGEKEEN